MTLNQYLCRYRITSQEFAKITRSSISSVNKWRMPGFRIPRPKRIKQIERATGGKVKLKDWYN